MMTIQEFIIKFREAFGDAAPLPVSLAYGATTAADVSSECSILLHARLYRKTNLHSLSR